MRPGAGELEPICLERKLRPATQVVARALAQPGITSIRLGVRNAGRARRTSRAPGVRLDEEEEHAITRVFETLD